MRRLIADSNLHHRISDVMDEVAIYSEGGTFLGWFFPVGPEMTAEERERVMKGPWMTTEEMIERLKRARRDEN